MSGSSSSPKSQVGGAAAVTEQKADADAAAAAETIAVADKEEDDDDEVPPLTPEQEEALLAAANAHKAEANAFFGRGQIDAALTAYEAAVAVLPVNGHGYDLAVLRSNMAACHIKLADWKEAVKAATQAVEALEADEKKEDENKGDAKEEEADEEIVSAGAQQAAPAPPTQAVRDRERIRVKALLRRARARTELGGWADLSGAEEDYRTLAKLGPDCPALTAADRRQVQTQLRQLPARTKAAQEREVGEMWGKLKELGNGLLRPFGISTDNFQMVKDEKSGGYSMNFRPGGQ